MTPSPPEDPRPWETLASHYLVRRHPWLILRQDQVRLPQGKIIPDYFVLEYPDWINVIAQTRDGRLVFIRQFRHALGSVHFELPAGVYDPDDGTLLEAAQRELLEETGFGGGHWQDWMTLSANPALLNNLNHTFLATDVEWRQAPQLDATEDIAVHLVGIEEAQRIVLAGEMIQALQVAPLLKFLLVGGEP
jgi:8-oxo-dGTP pyrophosphatase MutT (NUDIX family)